MSTTEAVRQDEVNRAVYYSRGVYLYYLSKSIMPVESACFSKYQQYIQGCDVLDIGVGAGRTARYLAPLARRYEAIDYSPVMVNYVRRYLPEVSIRQADFRNLRAFASDSFDFVLATANVIDALPHEGRLSALSEANRVLRPGGLLAFSTHNVNYEHAFSGPAMEWTANPVRLGYNALKYAIGAWNHRRVAPLRKSGPEYSLINDPGHFYSCLHYYVSRENVAAQLEKAGMRLIETLDRKGNALDAAGDDSVDPWLFYVGRKDATAGLPQQNHAAAAESR